MPDPAVISRTPNLPYSERPVQVGSYSSSLQILHKNWGAGLLRPYSIQSIEDGDAANNAQQVILRVPRSASHVGLHWVTQVVMSDTGANPNTLSAQIGSGGTTSYFFRVFGRIPSVDAGNSYGPFEAGLSNAVALNNSYGYWRALAHLNLAVNSAQSFFTNVTSTNVDALIYRVSTTRRLIINSIINTAAAAGLVNGYRFSPTNQPLQTTADIQASNAFDPQSGLIPLKGCEEILLVPEYFGTLQPVTITGTATAGTISSVDFTAIGATFHS
jgi:hypothetical protein